MAGIRNLKMTGALGLALVFMACAKGGDAGSTAPTAEGNVASNSTHESYRFKVSNCDTGKIEIKALTHAEAAKKLCDTLRSDPANNNCAQDLRKEFFTKRCAGQPWLPIRLNEAGDGFFPSTSGTTSTVVRNWELEQQTRNLMQFMVAEKHEVSSKLSKPLLEVTNGLADELANCGLNQLGPKCLDDVTLTTTSNGDFVTIDGHSYFITLVSLKNFPGRLFFKFALITTGLTPRLGRLTVSRVAKNRGPTPLRDYVQDDSNFEKLIDVTIAADFEKAAWQNLQSPTDIREIYHMSKGLLERTFSTDRYAATKTKLIEAILSARAVLSQSNDEIYQQAILALLTNELGAPKDTLVLIAEGLLKSKSSEVLQTAAGIILEAQPTRVELRPSVVGGLLNASWTTRLQAIRALAKTPNNFVEENLILAKLDDPIEDVQKSAFEVAMTMNLTDRNFPQLRIVGKSRNWTTRILVVKLLARTRSPRVNSELLLLLDDSVEDVRSTAFEILKSRTLDDDAVDVLQLRMQSDQWTVRRDAANLLGGIPTDHAKTILMRNFDDAVEDVSSAVSAQLQSRTIEIRDLEPLFAAYLSTKWFVRRDVVLLTGRVRGVEATNFLLSMLDDSVTDVVDTAIAQLESRPFTAASLPFFTDVLQARNWIVRKVAAHLLGKIKGRATQDMLEQRLVIEQVDDVRQEILASLKAIR